MPRFNYQVRDAAGRSLAGVMTAGSLEEASRLLRLDGQTVVDVRPVNEKFTGERSSRRIRTDEVIFFCTQLAVMVDTGVPLCEALDSICQQTKHEAFRAVLEDISDHVKAGMEFSAALQRHPKVFGRLFIAMMQASEAAGRMGHMLTLVSEYLADQRDIRKRLKGAMIYPVCMLVFCVVVVAALLGFVLPRFEKIYASKNAMLPAPTRVLLAVSHAFTTYWPITLTVIAAVVAGTWYYLRTPRGRIFLDRVRISMPIIGPMYRKAYLARSLRTMATMVTTGVAMLEGLSITAEVAGNHFYRNVWLSVAERVKQGNTLTSELAETSIIPPTVTQMIDAGERSGQLGRVMNRVAGFCEDDLKTAIKAATQLIEPLMIIVMGLLVGGIAIALLLPVFSLSKVVAQ